MMIPLQQRVLAARQTAALYYMYQHPPRTFTTLQDDRHDSSSTRPKLVHVPSLPFFGSTISSHSGAPKFDTSRFKRFWTELHDKYGSFYSFGFPGLGKGWHGTLYVIDDPHEMLKVLKMEGTYPSGIIQGQWPISSWVEGKGLRFYEFYGRDEGWKRYRSFLQRDLLSPQDAKEYLPAILEGAKYASQHAPTHGHDFNRYLNYCALDMFSMVLFGGHRKDTTPEEYDAFCKSAVYSMSEIIKIKREPMQIIAHKLGISTPRLKKLHENLDTVLEIATRRIQNFQKRREEGKLDEQERASYLAKAMERQHDSDLNMDEVTHICSMLLFAAVDTTAGKMAWNLLQLGLNPELQERLHEELDRAVQKEGELNANVFERSNTPLLQSFIRETHRLTPAIVTNIIKEISQSSVEVHGVTLPPGSIFAFDSTSPQIDPNLVENPDEFRPERWFPEEVKARKGTPREVIDHPFFSGPFSQGARKCPGSRVAQVEVQALLAQLILDWKLVLPKMKLEDVLITSATTQIPIWPEMKLEPRQ
jgi:cytochrome P450